MQRYKMNQFQIFTLWDGGSGVTLLVNKFAWSCLYLFAEYGKLGYIIGIVPDSAQI